MSTLLDYRVIYQKRVQIAKKRHEVLVSDNYQANLTATDSKQRLCGSIYAAQFLQIVVIYYRYKYTSLG